VPTGEGEPDGLVLIVWRIYLRNKMGQNIFGPLKILFSLTEIVDDEDKEK
jgi:hypothetical protein